MSKKSNSKPVYDLEERTFQFAKNVRITVAGLPKNMTNLEDGKQVTRSSGSVGSNYIEANESLSKKDFLMRVKICRKEAKESAYWLRLIKETNFDQENSKKDNIENDLISLFNESIELKKIFSAIIEKSK